MTVSTTAGNWIVSPQCAVWLPADFPHEMQMSGQVRMFNAFVRPEAQQAGELPRRFCVLSTSRLLRDLISEAVRQPAMFKRIVGVAPHHYRT